LKSCHPCHWPPAPNTGEGLNFSETMAAKMNYRPGIDPGPHVATIVYWPATIYTSWITRVYMRKCLLPRAEHTWLDYNLLNFDIHLFGCKFYAYIEDDTNDQGIGAIGVISSKQPK